MTIDNQTNKNQYTANGSNLAFGYGFKINSSDEVTIIVTDTAGADTTQVETTDYTVDSVGVNGGGNINFVTAPTNLYTVTIVRNVPLTQATDYIDNDSFASTGHEDGLDKTTMISQKQQEELDRSIKVRTSSDVTFNPEIDLTGGASKFLRINSGGTAIELAEGTEEGGAAAGLASVDGVSNAGGNVDFKSTDGTVTITPDDSANTIDFSASASQPFATLAGVSNSGSNVSMPAGTAMTVTPDDSANSITIAFDGSGVPANAISGNAVDGGTISDFASTGIDDNATSTKITITDGGTEITNDVTLKENSPVFNLEESDASSNEKVYRFGSAAGVFSLETLTDAFASGAIAMRILRTGTVVDEVELNATLLDFNGNVDMSGTVDCSGTESIKVPVGTTAQRPSSPTNGDTRYNTTTNKLESYINGSWEDIAIGSGSGETNTASALTSGGGTEGDVFKQKTGVDLEFRAIKQGTNITITENANDITISAAGTVGESNTSSNVGGKTGTIFKQKTGVDLELKTISGGTGITITNNASDIDIALSGTDAIFNVKDSGAVGDGSTDDTSSINTAITALLATTNGGILYFPAGKYRTTALITVSTGTAAKSFIVRGDGAELSQINTEGAFGGMQITFPPGGGWEGDKASIGVCDIAFETNQAGTQTGLKFINSGATSPAPNKFIKRVLFNGSGTAQYWGTALHLNECTFTSVDSVQIQGKSNTGAPWGGRGILFDGTADPVDVFITNCRMWQVGEGIEIKESAEGVYIDTLAIVGCETGIFWNTTAGEPLLTVTGSHINATSKCIDINNGMQFLIKGNLLYANGDRAGAWIGINVRGSYGTSGSVGGNISDNIFIVLAGASPVNGIVLESGVGSHTIVNNKLDSVDTGVWLQSGSDNNVVLDNYVTNFAANAVLDQGTNNTVRLIGSSSSFRGALVFLTSEPNISNVTPEKVTWQAEDYDTSGIFTAGSPTKLTVPAGVTRVRMTAQIGFDINSTGIRRAGLVKNNSGVYNGRTRVTVEATTSQKAIVNIVSPVLTVTGGNFFEIEVFQDSGAGLNLSSADLNWFSMEIVE